MVFYRKYRPQRVADLDSENVRKTLYAVLGKGTPHALLFTGPKGLGKTSTARIVAKAVNCTGRSELFKKGPESVEPCNTCDQCKSITHGTNMDIIEIDAASNRGIDEIRELKDKIRLSPLKAQKKVYIIDEVHMLTTEAFNALLKTLEEPPGHAMFILCTTEPHKVPPTILSRSFHISFQKATTEELVRSFERIAAGENLTITKDALVAIAKISDGGFRDGAKVLEELVSLSEGKPVTKELIESRYKVGSISQGVSDLLQQLETNDTQKALRTIASLGDSGIDIKYFMQECITALHEELLIAVGVTEQKTRRTTFDTLSLKELLLLFTRAHADVKFAVLSQIPLELAVIDWSESNTQLLDHETENIVTVETTRTTVKPATEVNLKTLRKTVGNIQKIKALYGENGMQDIKDKPSDSINTASVSLMHYDTGADTKEWVDNLWTNIISEVKSHNHTLAGVLRGCMLKSYDRKSLVIETQYTFHKEKLDDAKTKSVLETIIKQLTGNPVAISIELRK